VTSDADTELPVAEPPDEFDVYELVILRSPEGRLEIDEATADRLQGQHLGHLAAMRGSGHLKVAGPLDDQPDESWRGMCLYRVGSLAEARRLAELDPAVRAGCLSVEVMNWYTQKGAICFPE